MRTMAMQKPASMSKLSEKKRLSMPAPLAMHKPRSIPTLDEKNEWSRRSSTGLLPESNESGSDEAPTVATLDLLIAPVNIGKADLHRWLHRGSAGFISMAEEQDDANHAQQLSKAIEKSQRQTLKEASGSSRGSSSPSPPKIQAQIEFYRDLSPITTPYTFYNATNSSPPPSAWNSLSSTPVRTPRTSLRKPLHRRLRPSLPPSPPLSETPSVASAPVQGTTREDDDSISTSTVAKAETDVAATNETTPTAKLISTPLFSKALQRSNTFSGPVVPVSKRRTLITSPEYKERLVSGRHSAKSDLTADDSELEMMADLPSHNDQQQRHNQPPGQSHFTEHLKSRGSSLADIDEIKSCKDSISTETFLGITPRLSFTNEEDERMRAQGWKCILSLWPVLRWTHTHPHIAELAATQIVTYLWLLNDSTVDEWAYERLIGEELPLPCWVQQVLNELQRRRSAPVTQNESRFEWEARHVLKVYLGLATSLPEDSLALIALEADRIRRGSEKSGFFSGWKGCCNGEKQARLFADHDLRNRELAPVEQMQELLTVILYRLDDASGPKCRRMRARRRSSLRTGGQAAEAQSVLTRIISLLSLGHILGGFSASRADRAVLQRIHTATATANNRNRRQMRSTQLIMDLSLRAHRRASLGDRHEGASMIRALNDVLSEAPDDDFAAVRA